MGGQIRLTKYGYFIYIYIIRISQRLTPGRSGLLPGQRLRPGSGPPFLDRSPVWLSVGTGVNKILSSTWRNYTELHLHSGEQNYTLEQRELELTTVINY